MMAPHVPRASNRFASIFAERAADETAPEMATARIGADEPPTAGTVGGSHVRRRGKSAADVDVSGRSHRADALQEIVDSRLQVAGITRERPRTIEDV